MKRKFANSETVDLTVAKTSKGDRLTKHDTYDNRYETGKFNRLNKGSGLKSFETFPVEKFEKSFPYFREPFEFGSFSLGVDRQFKDSREKLRLYSPRDLTTYKPGLDLNIGFETFVGRNEDEPEKLDHLLKWIDLHREKFKSSSETNDCFQKWYGRVSHITSNSV